MFPYPLFKRDNLDRIMLFLLLLVEETDATRQNFVKGDVQV